jgi:hypothetical protein
MPALLKSICPKCQAVVKVDGALVGKRVRCPACKQAFELASVQSVGKSDSAESAPTANETLEAAAQETSREIKLPAGAKLGASQPGLGKLGRFELKELLGQGAYGRVYRAYDPQLDREVALKVPIFGPEDKHKIQRFSAEAKAAARLRHPNIVPTYESGQIGAQYYIAAQFVAGQTLAQRLVQSPPDFRQAAEWIRQLANGLAYAHAAGIVHRDIKPENIMLDERGVPHIMDFGLAKRTNDDSAMTTDGSILGTPAYMSPEQARGELAAVGPQSDQYSLGVVFYQMLTGKKPFEGSPHTVIAKVVAMEPPTPRSINRDIPEDLESICEIAMNKNAAERYPSCAEFGDDVARWLGGYETEARPLSGFERGWRWCRRNSVVAGLGTAVVLLLTFGLVTTATLVWMVSVSRDAVPTVHAIDSKDSGSATEQSKMVADSANLNAAVPAPDATGDGAMSENVVSPKDSKLSAKQSTKVAASADPSAAEPMPVASDNVATTVKDIRSKENALVAEQTGKIQISPDTNAALTTPVVSGDGAVTTKVISPQDSDLKTQQSSQMPPLANPNATVGAPDLSGDGAKIASLDGLDKSLKGITTGQQAVARGPTTSPKANRLSAMDVLALVDLTQFTTKSADARLETRSDGKSVIHVWNDGQSPRAVVFPIEFPAEYDLRLHVVRENRKGNLGLGISCLAADGRNCDIYLDGYFGSGINGIDGTDYKDPKTNIRKKLFALNKPSEIVCQVRTTGIRVVVDGKAIIDWKGDLSRLKHVTNEPSRVAIRTHDSQFAITKLELAPRSSSSGNATADSGSVERTTEPEIVSVAKIWDRAMHNGFTDLIRWHEKWYCSFREAEAQAGSNGQLRILESTDGSEWEAAALVGENGVDLRDPKLSITADDRLMIVAGGTVNEGSKIKENQPRVCFSTDGRRWTGPERVLSEGEWLWRLTWNEAKAYGISYNTAYRSIAAAQQAAKTGKLPTGPANWKPKLFSTSNGVKYDLVTHLDIPGHPSETTLRFMPDGEMIALVRRDGGNLSGWIGRSQAPYKAWSWQESSQRIGGPNFIRLPDGSLWAAGRAYGRENKTVLARMTAKGGYSPVLTLPSGGDTGYPGLVWHDGLLWMSYYSSHEGKPSIYLAKIQVPQGDASFPLP